MYNILMPFATGFYGYLSIRTIYSIISSLMLEEDKEVSENVQTEESALSNA